MPRVSTHFVASPTAAGAESGASRSDEVEGKRSFKIKDLPQKALLFAPVLNLGKCKNLALPLRPSASAKS
jgi:hypothetical protein